MHYHEFYSEVEAILAPLVNESKQKDIGDAVAPVEKARDEIMELFKRLQDGLKPPHECEIIARAPDMKEGRDWWVGRLTTPITIHGATERYCLHMKTPLKDVVFLLNDGDLGQIAVLMGCLQGSPIFDGWVMRIMPRAYKAAGKEVPQSLVELIAKDSAKRELLSRQAQELEKAGQEVLLYVANIQEVNRVQQNRIAELEQQFSTVKGEYAESRDLAESAVAWVNDFERDRIRAGADPLEGWVLEKMITAYTAGFTRATGA